MYIGHIYLTESMNGPCETFVSLIEALDRQGLRQHVLVRNELLARRVAVYESVALGPNVKTPVMAFCLMPNVQVVHIHCGSGASAGLLLTLTRSIPYVLTCREDFAATNNSLKQSIINRAAGLIVADKRNAENYSRANNRVPVDIIANARYRNAVDAHANNRIAADHLKIYRRAVDTSRVPAFLL